MEPVEALLRHKGDAKKECSEERAEEMESAPEEKVLLKR